MPSRSSAPPVSNPTAELSFEQALANLQEVVMRLESGALTLEETITSFHEGTDLAALCQRMIAEAELRITELSDAPSRSKPVEQAFEDVPF
jgi:exodeoxyribonuclease VII small subunit